MPFCAIPRLGGRPFVPQRLGWGSTYASKFERLKDGRLIMNTVRLVNLGACSNGGIETARDKRTLNRILQIESSPTTTASSGCMRRLRAVWIRAATTDSKPMTLPSGEPCPGARALLRMGPRPCFPPLPIALLQTVQPRPPSQTPYCRQGFKGVLQLPRTVTFSPETRSIVLFPISEVAKLRKEQVGGPTSRMRGWGCCTVRSGVLHAATRHPRAPLPFKDRARLNAHRSPRLHTPCAL
jgi:hypothetical protein